MAGSRRPGFWGSDDDDPIDGGTSCRAWTPAPGASLEFQAARFRAAATVRPRSAAAQPTHPPAKQPASAPSTSSGLRELVVTLVGPQTFGIGVTVGIAENLARSVVDLAGLAKTFLLADLYDRANGSTALAMIGPLGILQYGAAELAMWQFGDELKGAHADRQALIAEVTYAVTHPGEVFGNIKDDYVQKWQRFESLSMDGTLAGKFESGRIFGDVLVDVVSLIGTGAAAAKLAGKLPRLARLASRRNALAAGGGGGGGAAAARSAGAAVTPSQLAKTHTPPPVVEPPAGPAPARKPRTKSLREQYMGRTPGKSSKTGREVVERMRKEGTVVYDPFLGTDKFLASDGNWYRIDFADMSHKPRAAVTWWNEVGRTHGARSPEVREWMLDSDNYVLDHFKFNRSEGAILGPTERYLPPLK